MDELKDKLKKFSLFGKSSQGSSKAFQGKAHVLGSGATSQQSAPPRSAAQPAPARPVLRVPPPAPPAQPASAAVQPSTDHRPQIRLSEPTPVHPQQHTASAAPVQQQAQHADVPEAVRLAVAQLASEPAGPAAAEVLAKLLRNIALAPGDPKFRRVRLSNPRIQSAVVDVGGGLELLLACGFEVVFEEPAAAEGSGDGEGATAAEQGSEGYAVLPDGADLEPLQQALSLLASLAAAPSSSTTGGSRAPAAAAAGQQPRQQQQQTQQQRPARPPREWEPPRERNTQVVLPTSVEKEVPEWFFQRTGQELKAAFMSALRQREQGQVLMTRAMRERLRGPSLPAPSYATIRVKLPEGISLQGEFGAGEPVAAVFAWVADCLSDPMHTYELVLPSRQPLEPKAQSVREADLLPSVVLLFRWTGQSAAEMAHMPALRDELLRAARPASAAY